MAFTRIYLPLWLLLTILLTMAGFVIATESLLPEVAATHFNAAGMPDGFGARRTHVITVAIVVVVLPLFFAMLPGALAALGSSLVNIPNRTYWLDPARRKSTADFLRSHCAWFALIVAGFLVYIHWLVVRANQLATPRLSPAHLGVATCALGIALAIWIFRLCVRFRRPAS